MSAQGTWAVLYHLKKSDDQIKKVSFKINFAVKLQGLSAPYQHSRFCQFKDTDLGIKEKGVNEMEEN